MRLDISGPTMAANATLRPLLARKDESLDRENTHGSMELLAATMPQPL
jgi:hypothetical protein